MCDGFPLHFLSYYPQPKPHPTGSSDSVAARRSALKEITLLLRRSLTAAAPSVPAALRLTDLKACLVTLPGETDLLAHTYSLFKRALSQRSPLMREAALELVPIVREGWDQRSADNSSVICLNELLQLLSTERSYTVVKKTIDLVSEVILKCAPCSKTRLIALGQIFSTLAILLKGDEGVERASEHLWSRLLRSASTSLKPTETIVSTSVGSASENRLKLTIVSLASELWLAPLISQKRLRGDFFEGAKEDNEAVSEDEEDNDAEGETAKQHVCLKEVALLLQAGGRVIAGSVTSVVACSVLHHASSLSTASGGTQQPRGRKAISTLAAMNGAIHDVLSALYASALCNIRRTGFTLDCCIFLQMISSVDKKLGLSKSRYYVKHHKQDNTIANVLFPPHAGLSRYQPLLLIAKYLNRIISGMLKDDESEDNQKKKKNSVLSSSFKAGRPAGEKVNILEIKEGEGVAALLQCIYNIVSMQAQSCIGRGCAYDGERSGFFSQHLTPILTFFIDSAPSEDILRLSLLILSTLPVLVRTPPKASPAAPFTLSNPDAFISMIRLFDGSLFNIAELVGGVKKKRYNSQKITFLGEISKILHQMRSKIAKTVKPNEEEEEEEEEDDSDSSSDSVEIDDFQENCVILCRKLYIVAGITSGFGTIGAFDAYNTPERAAYTKQRPGVDTSRLGVFATVCEELILLLEDYETEEIRDALSGAEEVSQKGVKRVLDLNRVYLAQRQRIVALCFRGLVAVCRHNPFHYFRRFAPLFGRCIRLASYAHDNALLQPANLHAAEQLISGMVSFAKDETETVVEVDFHEPTLLSNFLKCTEDPTAFLWIPKNEENTGRNMGVALERDGSLTLSGISSELALQYFAGIHRIAVHAAEHASGGVALRDAAVSFVLLAAERACCSPIQIAGPLIALTSLRGETMQEGSGCVSISSSAETQLLKLIKRFPQETTSRVFHGVVQAFFLRQATFFLRPSEVTGFTSQPAGLMVTQDTPIGPVSSVFAGLYAVLADAAKTRGSGGNQDPVCGIFCHLLTKVVLPEVDMEKMEGSFVADLLQSLFDGHTDRTQRSTVTYREVSERLHLVRFLLEVVMFLPFLKQREVHRVLHTIDVQVEMLSEKLVSLKEAYNTAKRSRAKNRPLAALPWEPFLAMCGLNMALVAKQALRQAYAVTTRQQQRFEERLYSTTKSAVPQTAASLDAETPALSDAATSLNSFVSTTLQKLSAASKCDEETKILGTITKGVNEAVWCHVADLLEQQLNAKAKSQMAYGKRKRRAQRRNTRKRKRRGESEEDSSDEDTESESGGEDRASSTTSEDEDDDDEDEDEDDSDGTEESERNALATANTQSRKRALNNPTESAAKRAKGNTGRADRIDIEDFEPSLECDDDDEDDDE